MMNWKSEICSWVLIWILRWWENVQYAFVVDHFRMLLLSVSSLLYWSTMPSPRCPHVLVFHQLLLPSLDMGLGVSHVLVSIFNYLPRGLSSILLLTSVPCYLKFEYKNNCCWIGAHNSGIMFELECLGWVVILGLYVSII